MKKKTTKIISQKSTIILKKIKRNWNNYQTNQFNINLNFNENRKLENISILNFLKEEFKFIIWISKFGDRRGGGEIQITNQSYNMMKLITIKTKEI